MNFKKRIEKLEQEIPIGTINNRELPEWALKAAWSTFSEPRHPLYRMYQAMNERSGKEFKPDDSLPRDNPDYIEDPQEREAKILEYARELYAKYGANKPDPIRDYFRNLCRTQS